MAAGCSRAALQDGRTDGWTGLLAGHLPPKAVRAGELCCLVCQSTDLLTFSLPLGLGFAELSRLLLVPGRGFALSQPPPDQLFLQ